MAAKVYCGEQEEDEGSRKSPSEQLVEVMDTILKNDSHIVCGRAKKQQDEASNQASLLSLDSTWELERVVAGSHLTTVSLPCGGSVAFSEKVRIRHIGLGLFLHLAEGNFVFN